jgi:hypothetical protein
MDVFAHPPPTPASIDYTSAQGSYSAFGWQVVMARKVEEFSTLSAAGRDGFILRGSGSALVRTPGRYRRGGTFIVRVVSPSGQFAPFTRVARVGQDHRLALSVPLGPSNTVQEYPLDGPALGTTIYITQVSWVRR